MGEREQQAGGGDLTPDDYAAEYEATKRRVIAGTASVQEAQGFIDFIEEATPARVVERPDEGQRDGDERVAEYDRLTVAAIRAQADVSPAALQRLLVHLHSGGYRIREAGAVAAHQPAEGITDAEIDGAAAALRVAMGPRLDGLTDLVVRNGARQILEGARP